MGAGGGTGRDACARRFDAQGEGDNQKSCALTASRRRRSVIKQRPDADLHNLPAVLPSARKPRSPLKRTTDTDPFMKIRTKVTLWLSEI